MQDDVGKRGKRINKCR